MGPRLRTQHGCYSLITTNSASLKQKKQARHIVIASISHLTVQMAKLAETSIAAICDFRRFAEIGS